MPTIDISRKDLERLVGKKFSQKELEEALMFVKGEIDSAQGDSIKVDVKETNRPDLWSTEGIAREIRARIGRQKGVWKPKVGKPRLSVRIEKSVKEARPYTVGAVVRGIKVTENLLLQMIQLQEKVDGTHGRKRKESSTGIYDFDKIKGDIRYYGAEPGEKKFTPLEFKAEMDLDEILEMHPKGREYGHLLKGKKLYPIFEDSQGNVLSMPPIINSNYSGKVTEKTRNLFVEVSGFDRATISAGLKVMVMALADRGGKIEAVNIMDSDGKKSVTPEFGTKKMVVDPAHVEKVAGIHLGTKKMVELLEKAGMRAKTSGKKIVVWYPDYRQDIIHAIDIIEDIIISYGYNNIKPRKPEMSVVGEELKESLYLDKARDVCVGLGLQEILTFNLTSREKQETLVGLTGEKFVEIANPVSANWSIMRKNIYPELLEFASKNKHNEYPQKIFEIGKTVHLDPSTDTMTTERNRLCILLLGKGYGFTLIKSVFEAVCRELGKKCFLAPLKHASLREGKSARISGDSKGILGELSDKTAKNFGLEQQAVILEMDL